METKVKAGTLHYLTQLDTVKAVNFLHKSTKNNKPRNNYLITNKTQKSKSKILNIQFNKRTNQNSAKKKEQTCKLHVFEKQKRKSDGDFH